MTIYATTDNEGDYINEGAYIAKFDSETEAEDYLLAAHDLDGSEYLEFCHGQYADCWLKTLSAPRVGARVLAPFTFNQVRVARPGSHPGGKKWWLTPAPDVWILRVES